VSVPSGIQASVSTVRIRLADTISTGGGGGTPSIALHDDQVSLEITFTPPITPKVSSETGTYSVAEVTSVVKTTPAPIAGSDSGTCSVVEASNIVKANPPSSVDIVVVNSGTAVSASTSYDIPITFQAGDKIVAFASYDTFSSEVPDVFVLDSDGAPFARDINHYNVGRKVVVATTTKSGSGNINIENISGAEFTAIFYILRGCSAVSAPVFNYNAGSNPLTGLTTFSPSLRVVFGHASIFRGIIGPNPGVVSDRMEQDSSSAYHSSSAIVRTPNAGTAYSDTSSGDIAQSTEFKGSVELMAANASPVLRDVKFAENARFSGTSTSVSLVTKPGDVLVVKTASEGVSTSTITGGGLVWTQRAAVVGSPSQADARIFTAIANADATLAITASWTDTGQTRSMVAESWSESALASSPAVVNVKDGSAPSATVTTTQSDSVLTWASVDWAAVSGANVYRGAPRPENVTGTAGQDYRATYAWQPAEIAGANVFGMTGPTGQSPSMVGMEIQYIGKAAPVVPTDKSAADTGTHSVSESSSIRLDSAVSLSDSSTHSTVESSSINSIVSVADSGTLSAADSSALFIDARKSVTDTGTLSQTTGVSISSTLSMADSGTLNATESSVIFKQIGASDFGSMTAQESASVFNNAVTLDTGTHVVNESSTVAISGQVPLSGADSGVYSASDASAITIASSISVSEDIVYSAAEFAGVSSSSSRQDSGTETVLESSSNYITSSRADSGTHTTSDTATVSVVIATSDTLTETVEESSTTLVVVNVVDAGTDVATEYVAAGVYRFLNDAGAESVQEQRTISINSYRSESGELSADEQASLSSVIQLGDSGIISAVEGALVSVPYREYPVTDSGVLSASESATIDVFLYGSEMATISASDSISIYRQIELSDGGTESVTESTSKAVNYAVSDTGVHSTTETSGVFINAAKSVSESVTHSSSEGRSIYGQASLSEFSSLSVIESALIYKSISLSDTGAHSVSESSSVFNDRPSADFGIHSTSESSSIKITGLVEKPPGSSGAGDGSGVQTDAGEHSATEQRGLLATADRVDSAIHSIQETASIYVKASYSDSGDHIATENSAELVCLQPVGDYGNLSADEAASVEIHKFTGVPVGVWDVNKMLDAEMVIWNGYEFVKPMVSVWTGSGWGLDQ
jgi:hypothetical protein